MISILCPTRGRPDQLAAMWATARETAEGPIELVTRLDDDDRSDYPDLGDVRISGPRGLLSSYWNDCHAAASGEIFMHAGDDIRFRTAAWDTRVVEVFESVPDRIVFVHGDDGFQHERLGTHGFLHRRWVEAVGYFVPPYFSSDYNDTWLTEVADRIGRRVYLPDVVTEHMHPNAGKGEWDLTHRERLARHSQDDVDALYRSLDAARAADAAKLQAVMA